MGLGQHGLLGHLVQQRVVQQLFIVCY